MTLFISADKHGFINYRYGTLGVIEHARATGIDRFLTIRYRASRAMSDDEINRQMCKQEAADERTP
ncbi:MAG TPA: hypothetical protein VM531_09005 [Sphingomicrobium sp.]|jgi:hypothetical protein|nr:hypothetical protein [Sphingomicrobium sp.]